MRRLLVALLVIAGCHKSGPQAGSSPKDADALWALAPEGAVLGVVVTPRGIAMLEHGWQDLHAFVDKAPELAPIAKEMDDRLRSLTGGSADIRLADYGLTSEKGGALFVIGPNRIVLVVPLGDRDKFLAKARGTKGSDADQLQHGSCKTVKGFYACASTPELFDAIGKATLRDKLEARGDVEVVAQGIPGMPMKSAAGVAQLERGQITVRGSLAGVPANVASQLGAPVKPDVDRGHSAGFGVLNLAAVVAQVPDVPIGAGVTTQQLAKSFAGPLLLSVPAGELAFDVRIPLTDPAPAQTLVEHCTDLLPAMLGATSQGGACHVPVPVVNVAVDAWVDGKTLRLGMKGAPQGKAVPLTQAGAELAEGSWSFAFWGRGTALAAPALPVPGEAQQDPEFQLGIRAMMLVNEMGIGVRADGDKLSFLGVMRTAWANPDDVVAKLAALPTADLLAGKGSAVAQSIPGSAPLATDMQAGYAGLMLPISLVGVMSAVAIPAFIDYTQKSKQTEASILLNKIAKNAKIAFTETGTFPVGDAPLTPAAPCCKGPNARCPVDPKSWSTPVWTALDFAIDEPALFQYSYHSDGKTAEATAVGDLDCDGIAVTYHLELTSDASGPHAAIQAPPANSD